MLRLIQTHESATGELNLRDGAPSGARDGLHDPERRQDAVTALRAMVDEIVLTPQGDELGILLKGDLAAMLAAARKTKRPSESDDLSLQVSLVAGARNQHYLQLWRPAA